MTTTTPDTDRLAVRYEVVGREIFIDGEGKLLTTRAARRALRHAEKSLVKRFGHLQHPETGERPTLFLSIPTLNLAKPSVQMRLDTPSQSLRDWLAEQGIVIEESFKPIDGAEPSSDAAIAQ